MLNKTSKTTTKGKKAINAVKTADKVKDGAKAVREIMGEQDESSPVKILDYLSFEH